VVELVIGAEVDPVVEVGFVDVVVVVGVEVVEV